MIRDATIDDSEAIAEIYNHYIVNTSITFEETPVSRAEMSTRIKNVQLSELPWIVALKDNNVVGYAYATKWKERSAYRFSVESTVYISNQATGEGIGTLLYKELLRKLKARNINNVIGGITLPNPASVGLHEKMAMKKVAHFPHVGFKFGEWLDVGYWQLSLSSYIR